MSDGFAYKKSKQLQINELEHEVKTVDGRAAEAHARIDAVVQRVVDLENGDCDFTEALGIIRRRLTALESTVEALKHVRITDIARVTALYNRLTALESAPRSEPVRDDPMCDECGHRKSCHSDGHGCGFGQCYCREFVAPTPEAATAQPVDPVLMAISGAWKQWHRQSARSLVVGSYLEYAFRSQAGIHESRDITRDLMSYGSSS